MKSAKSTKAKERARLGQLPPDSWKRKAREKEKMDHNARKMLSEKRRFESSINRKVHVFFVNIGLGKQKTAKNFWVSLDKALSLSEINERLERAFGDLK